MIPHPSVEKLLAEHGNTRAGRQKARAAMTAAMVEYARRAAVTAGLSMNCEALLATYGPEHHPCGNPNGRSCLCVCHDPKEATGGN